MPHPPVFAQTAADTLAMWNSFARIAGTRTVVSPPVGTRNVSFVQICALARTRAGDSLNRKLLTGPLILPFSTRNTPSRVKPVIVRLCGSIQRVYQNRV